MDYDMCVRDLLDAVVGMKGAWSGWPAARQVYISI